MFINDQGVLQCESFEEIEENKDLVFEEFTKWDVPNVDTIALTIVDSFNSAAKEMKEIGMNYELTSDNIKDQMYFVKLGYEMALDKLSNIFGEHSLVIEKMNKYINNTYLAIDKIIKDLEK